MDLWLRCPPSIARWWWSPPSLVLQDDWGSLLVMLKGLVLDLVDGDDFVDFLDGGDDLGLVLVVLVNHGLVDFDDVEVVLVDIMLMDVVLVKVLLVDGVDVDIVLVEMVPKDDLFVLVVLMDLVLVVVKMLNLLLMGVIVVDFVDMFVSLDDLWLIPSPPPTPLLVMVMDCRFFPSPAWR